MPSINLSKIKRTFFGITKNRLHSVQTRVAVSILKCVYSKSKEEKERTTVQLLKTLKDKFIDFLAFIANSMRYEQIIFNNYLKKLQYLMKNVCFFKILIIVFHRYTWRMHGTTSLLHFFVYSNHLLWPFLQRMLLSFSFFCLLIDECL